MFKKGLKKFINYSFLALSISFLLSTLYIFFPKLLDSIDNQIRDYLFLIRGEIPNSDLVYIVDIDERSLKTLGQWPWSRDKMSKIVENLNSAAAIGMDIVFAEEDRTSPSFVAKELNLNTSLRNYDEEFAKTLENSAVILGYAFELSDGKYIGKDAPQIPAIFIEKGKKDDFAPKAYGTILNTPIIQNSAYSSGFFNVLPDPSGIIRSVPLLISYDDFLYPSLSLEIIRAINQSEKVLVNYDENGVKNIELGEFTIPTDRYGRVFVNYRGAQNSFKYISALDVYNGDFNEEEIDGKIILLGTSATGLFDLRATPFDSIFPGVEVHANVLDNILEGDFIQKPSWADGANIALIFFFAFIIVYLTTYTPLWVNPFIFATFTLLFLYGNYLILFDEGVILNIIFPLNSIFLAAFLTTILDYFENIRSERAIKAKFASKVSKSVMEDILKNSIDGKFKAQNKEITIFFSDIRGFTNISEKLTPNELIGLLNRYMDPMSNIITKYSGTIDKYIGDSIMAYWNAPIELKNHADLALEASIEQLRELKELNKIFEDEGLPRIEIGIGLNSGEAIVGEMGSVLRSDYTVIGDTINLGSRVESLCKYYDSRLNITNFTKSILTKNYTFRFLDLVKVKGKDEPVEIWQVLEEKMVGENIENELRRHHEAIELYKSSNFKDALKIFKELEEKEDKTNQKIYKIYMQRCSEFIKNPPLNFNGVYEHSSK